MPRLFTALEVPRAVALTLAQYRGGLPGARWIDSEYYHITLRFIGDIDDGTARDLMSVLGDTRRREAIPVDLNQLASFGGDRPRAIFARVEPCVALLELQAEHERAVRRLRLPPETRKFTPHITLARLRDASPIDVADYLSSRGIFARQIYTASRFVVYSSRNSIGGGPYVIEAAYPLG
jgi:RNA 2',3'-cyclic 3'-phosphodiesterase